MTIQAHFKKVQYIFFALATAGKGISGSDRIFIELAGNWSEKYRVNIYTGVEGERLCKIQNLKGKYLKIYSAKNSNLENNFILNYLYKIIEGIRIGLTLNLDKINESQTYLYSASEFWMDSFPCVLLKLRYPKAKWIASWYQTAPNPIKGFNEGGTRSKKYFGSSLAYWLMQLPVKPLIKKFTDVVIVNNESEKDRFPEHTKRGNTVVLLGAVPLKDIDNWKLKNKNLPKVYDAVFQGRFHPQKGVVELIDIWKMVVDKIPTAKLAMIGDGPLMGNVRSKIADYGLGENIELFGYVFDGPKKYSIFSSSKLVVHPALYDSGGMAAAETMAFGVPAVGFNLKAYESYYPRGMVKVRIGDISEFSDEIIKLLRNNNLRIRKGGEAQKMIEKNWSWEKRADEILNKITK